MTDERVRELLIAFAEEAGKHSIHGPVFPMFRKLWQFAHTEGGRRGLWICPALAQEKRRQKVLETFELKGAVSLVIRRLFPDLAAAQGRGSWYVCEERDDGPFPVEGPFDTEMEADWCCAKRYKSADVSYVRTLSV